MAACAAAVEAAFPGRPLGAVFANAGVLFNKTILGSSLEDWKTTLNVNVLGVVNTIKAFVPAMQRQPTASVVCATASVGGLVRGDGGAGSYQASKHAVVAICETLSFELAARYPQIRVHVLCPCIANSALPTTSQTNKAVERGELPEVTDSSTHNSPLSPAAPALLAAPSPTPRSFSATSSVPVPLPDPLPPPGRGGARGGSVQPFRDGNRAPRTAGVGSHPTGPVLCHHGERSALCRPRPSFRRAGYHPREGATTHHGPPHPPPSRRLAPPHPLPLGAWRCSTLAWT